MNITVSQNAVNAIPQMVSTLKSMGFPKLAVENCRTGIISAIMRHFTSMNSKMPGYCHYDIPGRKYRFVFTYRMSPTQNMALITGVSIRKRPVENTGFPVNEEKRNVIRLTEEDLRRMVKKAVRKVSDTLGRDNRCAINEESYIHPKAKPIKLGEWEEIDSLPLDTILTGFEDKGYVLPQCLFLNKEKNEGFGLYKRADNNKYFYLKLVPDENNVITYVSVKRSDVPEVILSDFPQYLRRAWERIRPIIEKEH